MALGKGLLRVAGVLRCMAGGRFHTHNVEHGVCESLYQNQGTKVEPRSL